jgi:hypothetical protein
MTTNPNFAGGLTQALQTIAQQVISCSYPVPVPADGRIIDSRKIKLTYTPGNGSPAQDLKKATSSACTDGQWFISSQDANGIPTGLELCPDTCAMAQADDGAQIQVTFTCIQLL